MPTFNTPRARPVNDRPPARDRAYVLYWMQAYRRLDRNHALDYAVAAAKAWAKPLVVYEGLRLDYPWASGRHHAFMLEGMAANAKAAKMLGVNYWPFVETPDRPARGLLRKLAANACLVVTDDYPAFIVPGQTAALADRVDVPVTAVDGNSLVPLAHLGPAVSAAAHLRPRIHKAFADAWAHRAAAEPDLPQPLRTKIDPPFEPWDPSVKVDAFIGGLPIDQSVGRVPGVTGGCVAGRKVLATFLADKLPRYGEGRNAPDDPDATAQSRLSPYLRHGHVSIQEVAEGVLGDDWEPGMLNPAQRGKREGYFHPDANVNSFLDEALTWRDVGYHWHYRRNEALGARAAEWKAVDGVKVPAYFDLASTLPEWAKATLTKHAKDSREFTYSLGEWEAATTHDELWNAAQKELVATGRIHNYLRMLWGKKVLEWSRTPEEAYLVLEHLNNKYAIDGRDPNSYTGVLWTFGLFDRPWAPERPVFGTVRFMSSGNTAKKFKLDGYYEYVERVTNPGRPRAGLGLFG
ncbi:MAG TPA: deoxyribodipyrimidine photolyase [Gemmataceae bacterium]|nr:deoxyribodipyrimidine photolyase [Gemmataceae bacterium]